MKSLLATLLLVINARGIRASVRPHSARRHCGRSPNRRRRNSSFTRRERLLRAAQLCCHRHHPGSRRRAHDLLAAGSRSERIRHGGLLHQHDVRAGHHVPWVCTDGSGTGRCHDHPRHGTCAADRRKAASDIGSQLESERGSNRLWRRRPGVGQLTCELRGWIFDLLSQRHHLLP